MEKGKWNSALFHLPSSIYHDRRSLPIAHGRQCLRGVHRGATLTREELLNEVWGYNSMPSTRTVDVHVAWLRQKIEPNPRHPQFILTVHGMGYKFAG